MTLLHSIVSLVHAIAPVTAAPCRDAWPEYTVHRSGDVEVAGVSLLELAQQLGTPCVRNAAAVIPGTGGIPSPFLFASVVVTRVLAVVPASPSRMAQVWVDAELDGCRPLPAAVRLLGRTAGRRAQTIRLRPDTKTMRGPTIGTLPADIREGDLLAVPCVGATAVHEIRARSRHPERLSHDRFEQPWEEFPNS